MELQGKKLFDISSVTDTIDKFNINIEDLNKKLDTIDKELEKIGQEYDKAIENDVMNPSTSTKKNLLDVTARRENVENKRKFVVDKISKLQSILQDSLSKLMPEMDKQMHADLQTYKEKIEREFYRQLFVIRRQQAELLLLLQKSRHEVMNELWNFSIICGTYGFTEYKHSYSDEMWHNNMSMPSKSFPEYENPLIQCNYLPAIETILIREHANANAAFDKDASEEVKKQLPINPTFADVDLDAFLKGIKDAE